MLTFTVRFWHFHVPLMSMRRLNRASMEAPTYMTLYVLLSYVLTILEFAIIGRALMSWFDRGMTNPISQILVQITEPIIAPIRRIVPSAGMLDLSPMVAILLIIVLQRMLSTAAA